MQYVFFGCRKAPDVSTNREGLGGLKIPNVPHMPEGIHVAGESATLRGSPLHFPLHNSSQPLPAVQRALPTFRIVDGLSASSLHSCLPLVLPCPLPCPLAPLRPTPPKPQVSKTQALEAARLSTLSCKLCQSWEHICFHPYWPPSSWHPEGPNL